MKEFWNTIQFIFTAIGGWLGYFLGGCDGLLYTLLAFVVLDYLTGVMCAITDHKLSSHIGFKGIFRKVLIFYACRRWPSAGHAGARQRRRASYCRDILLSVQ